MKIGARPSFVLFVFVFLSFLPLALALQIPSRPEGYVHDQAGLLEASLRATLEDQLKSFEDKTSNQVVVATFPSLEGASLEDFSIRLAQAWKVGQKGKNNGVIFLIFKNDRQMRIEVGYGLEGVLPDLVAGQIIREVVTPFFRNGDYAGGIMAGVEAIFKATQGEFKAAPKKDEGPETLTKFIILLFVFFFFYGFVQRSTYRINGRGGRSGGFYGGFPTGGGGFSSGGGFGGGFSGGGGSFGGGGASGRW